MGLYINGKTSVIFDQSFQVEQKYIPLLWKLTFQQKVGMEEATKESNELRKDEMPILHSDNTIKYCTKRKNEINYCVCYIIFPLQGKGFMYSDLGKCNRS